MTKLTWKPCPFCGGTDICTTKHPREGRGFHKGEDVYSMCCYQCGAQVPNRYGEHGLMLMNEQWNKRVANPSVATHQKFKQFLDGA